MARSVNDIRLAIRHRRRQLGVGARYRAANRLLEKTIRLRSYQQSQHVAFYVAADGEVSCRELIKHAWSNGKTCYLPVLSQNSSCGMRFVRYIPFGRLARNRYNILEPRFGCSILPQVLDMVIVPLVAFDDAGNRIGMGGGFYDRTFAFRRSKSEPALIGAAYNLQRVQNICPQAWDIKLDAVLAV